MPTRRSLLRTPHLLAGLAVVALAILVAHLAMTDLPLALAVLVVDALIGLTVPLARLRSPFRRLPGSDPQAVQRLLSI